MIDEHEPSAVQAHAMLVHNGEFNFSFGIIAVKKPYDERKAYEALVCKEIGPELNKQHMGGGNVPI